MDINLLFNCNIKKCFTCDSEIKSGSRTTKYCNTCDLHIIGTDWISIRTLSKTLNQIDIWREEDLIDIIYIFDEYEINIPLIVLEDSSNVKDFIKKVISYSDRYLKLKSFL
jgi:hypothetical protein